MSNRNADDFDNFVKQLQAEIDAKDKEDFSKYALDLARNPYKEGKLREEDVNVIKHKYRGPCGDAIILYLKIQDQIIVDIRYLSDGCTTSSIAGSQMAKMADGKSLDQARKITQEDILHELGKFPEESEHCCLLAARTLHQTIDKYKKQYNN